MTGHVDFAAARQVPAAAPDWAEPGRARAAARDLYARLALVIGYLTASLLAVPNEHQNPELPYIGRLRAIVTAINYARRRYRAQFRRRNDQYWESRRSKVRNALGGPSPVTTV